MWCADNWKDYELIDTSDGERLERWGKYILIRPDPQIIWKGCGTSPLWKRADGIYRRSNTGGGAWVKNQLPAPWNIRYGELGFVLRPRGFKHTGLFPEHTWKYICNREYDLFVMELTIGDHPDAPHLFSHMTLSSFTLMINTMRRRYRPVKEGGTFLVTHLAKNWHKPHAELIEQLAPLGVTPAYDGYVVEI